MGNSVVKDFKDVKLGEGSLPPIGKGMIAQRSLILEKPMTVLIKRDHHRKSTIFFDLASMLPLYVTTSKKCNRVETTITKDRLGNALFLTSSPSKDKKLIYKAPSNIAPSSPTIIMETGSPSTSTSTTLQEDQSHASSLSSSSEHNHCLDGGLPPRRHPHHHSDDVPCAAQIDIDRSGAAVCAFLGVYLWNGSGPELRSVYKAFKIANVKYGVLVMDMNGNVVGKASLDEQRMQPLVEVAAGTDLPCVLALASSLMGDRIL